MATVAELFPGDIVDSGGVTGLFIARTVHPLWPTLRLVIWQISPAGHALDDGTPRWSLDALDEAQDVGVVRPADDLERRLRLRAALIGAGQGHD